jgi:hypothetical protein
MLISGQTPAEIADLWDRQHVTTVVPSNARHKDVKAYIDMLKSMGLKTEEVGRSYQNREIYQLEFGSGPIKVFMWSQMHGDEPTATSAIIDLFAIFKKNPDAGWVKNIEKTMTIRAVPMLNPDGTELYQRRNAMGLDINRDARDLRSPEAVLLKKLRDEWSPEIGFNLHNQKALTTVGMTTKQATISFLVVFGDAAKTTNEGYERNKRLVSAMSRVLQQFVPGGIGRYDDAYAPTAFGDNFSAWGTPVILIETGGLYGKDEMFLVKLNFIAFVTALRSIADGSEKMYSPANYEMLLPNSSGRVVDVIFRNASVRRQPRPENISRADIGLIRERRRAEFEQRTVVSGVGDLSRITGLEEYDASGFEVAGRNMELRSGLSGELLFYRRGRDIDWTAPDLAQKFPPDAVYSGGRWTVGEGVVPRKP